MADRVSIVALRHPEIPGMYLYGKRHDSKAYQLPGGHAEDGETPLEAAIRELKEETDIDQKKLEHIKTVTVERKQGYVEVSLFIGEYPKDCKPDVDHDVDDEFTKLKFLSPIMHDNMHVPAHKDIFLKYLLEEGKHEDLDKEELEKRSKNVREQTRNITPQKAESRRVNYAQKIGLKPVKQDNIEEFPEPNKTTIPYNDKFGVEHETAHAMMTPKNKTIAQYTNDLGESDRGYPATVDESTANRLESMIDRRAGVGNHYSKYRRRDIIPSAYQEDEEDYLSDYPPSSNDENATLDPFTDRARSYQERFDQGAKFDESGKILNSNTLNSKINTRPNDYFRFLLKLKKSELEKDFQWGKVWDNIKNNHTGDVSEKSAPHMYEAVKKYPQWELKNIPLKNLDLDVSQPLPEREDEEWAKNKYAKMKTKAPPITLYQNSEGKWNHIDGRHRSRAAFLRGESHIQAYVPANLTKSEPKGPGIGLVHYGTTAGLTQLDPGHMGTGIGAAGNESKRGTPDLKRTYYYREGTQPEPIVAQKAKAKYSANLEPHHKLYDVGTDPDGIYAKLKAASMNKEVNPGVVSNEDYLQAVKDHGYHGYHNSTSALPGAVALFHAHPVVEDMGFRKSELNKGQNGDWQKEGYQIKMNGDKDNLEVHAFDPAGRRIGEVFIDPTSDGRIYSSNTRIHPYHQRKGLATAMYNLAEKHTGRKMIRSDQVKNTFENLGVSSQGKSLWNQPNRPFGKSEYFQDMLSKARPNHAKNILAMHNASGGSTYNMKTGDQAHSDAYSVSPYLQRSQIVKEPLTENHVNNFIKQNKDLLSKPNHNVGIWRDPDTGHNYMDVSVTVPDKDKAIALGKKFNQKAIYHLGSKTTIPTGGTGEAKNNYFNSILNQKKYIKDPYDLFDYHNDYGTPDDEKHEEGSHIGQEPEGGDPFHSVPVGHTKDSYFNMLRNKGNPQPANNKVSTEKIKPNKNSYFQNMLTKLGVTKKSSLDPGTGKTGTLPAPSPTAPTGDGSGDFITAATPTQIIGTN